MEKLLEQALLWFSCFNPPTIAQIEYGKPQVMVQHTKNFSINSFFDDLDNLYSAILTCDSLMPRNHMHLTAFQKKINQFKDQLLTASFKQKKSYNLMPAFKKLSEALEDDNRVWDKYCKAKKIPKQFYQMHTQLLQQFKDHIIKKTKLS